MDEAAQFLAIAGGTLLDIAPVIAVIFFFQYLIIRRRFARLQSILIGLAHLFVGLTLFRIGLELSLFPMGTLMAEQLTAPEFTGVVDEAVEWQRYFWVYLFAAALGFTTTLVEPTLIATAERVYIMSGGAIRAWDLRLAVALGVATGLAFGTLRIVIGVPLEYCIAVLLAIVALQSFYTPKLIVPLAYDAGAVATSIVTVPLIAALGLGVAAAVLGRSPLLDGFGLILLALLFPMVTVMGFAQLAVWRSHRRNHARGE